MNCGLTRPAQCQTGISADPFTARRITPPPGPHPPGAKHGAQATAPARSNRLDQIQQRQLLPMAQLHPFHFPLSPTDNLLRCEPMIQRVAGRTTFLSPEIVSLLADLLVEIEVNQSMTVIAAFHNFLLGWVGNIHRFGRAAWIIFDP